MEKKSNHPLATAIVSHFTPIKTVDLEVEHKIGSDYAQCMTVTSIL